MKNIIIIICLLLLVHYPGFAQSDTLKTFLISSVRLLPGPFKEAQDTDLQYMLKLDIDRLLAPYLKEAEIESKALNYDNWEGTGLNGHIGGHYLSALAYMYASTGNKDILQRLNYMVDWLEKCQQQNGDGYVGGIPGSKVLWKDIAQGKIKAAGFSLNDKWVPWYNIHKLFAGLVDAYRIAGNEKAKNILIKLSDWCQQLTSGLSDSQIQAMLESEHGGMNEALADVAAITGDSKYLELARRFSHRKILNPLLSDKDSLTGLHANTQIPKVIGYMRIAETSGDTALAHAARFFWQTVVTNRTVSIGGNSVREHFNPSNNFSTLVESREGPETCNTYNMLKLTTRLFLSRPSAYYMDYYERALYNHILSSQHPDGGFVYFTPMRPRHYRVYSQPHQSFWCCVGSGFENHSKYGELIYAHNDRDLFINLFIASNLSWKAKGLVLTQTTNFPFEELSKINLQLKRPEKFSLYFRYPSWIRNGDMKVRINKKEIQSTPGSSGYVRIEREWKSGDIITVALPMHTSVERLPDQSSWVSFLHGPIVLGASTGTTELNGLRADSSRMGHIANGPLYSVEDAPLIISSGTDVAAALSRTKGKPLTFTASSLIYPDKYKDLKLVPFFRIHDARYIVYWPIATPGELEKRKQTYRSKENALLALEAQTVDHVAAGEQQPESDHNFKGEKSEVGLFRERHWRSAAGWFSYDLKNKGRTARKLVITYNGRDKNRIFDIYINEKLLKTESLNGAGDDNFFDLSYNLPQDMTTASSSETINLKFVAHPGSLTGAVYYVRLLK